MITARVFITGVVQGVGFRQFVRENAKKMGITGWVANSSEGKVEAVFQSKDSSEEGKNKIQELIEICKKGPFMAEVRGIEIKWEEIAETIDGFEIRK